MLEWFIFAAVGKLIIYLWMKFPLPQTILDNIQEKYIYQFIKQLHECDLCSGTYLFTILAFFMRIDMLVDFGFWHVPIVSEFVSGAISSFMVHIFSIGWKTKFEVIVI